MARCTIFDLTLLSGENRSIFFEGDCVVENDLERGQVVRVVPSGSTFKVELGLVGFDERGVLCRIMSVDRQRILVNAGQETRDAWVLHLAAIDLTSSYH